MSGALNFKNATWNLVGDDVYIGDCDIAGGLGLKGANGQTNLVFYNYSNSSYYTKLITQNVASNLAVYLPTASGTLALTSDIPTSLKNPNALTIQANGTTLVTYDGSSALTANLTYSNVGAAAASHTHDYLPLAGGTMTGTLTSNAIIPSTTSTYDLGTSSLLYKDGYFSGTVYGAAFEGQIKGGVNNGMLKTPSAGCLRYDTCVLQGTTGLFYTTTNANSILSLDRYGYNATAQSQLGFSSSGRIYYRTKIDTSTAWETLSYVSDLDAYLPLSGGTMTGTITFANLTGSNVRNILYGLIADDDYFRLQVGGTATNSGYVELATADDGSEPIYIRQYTGVFTAVKRTATILDANGNTSFPGTVTAPTFSGALSGNASTATALTTDAGSATLPIYFSGGKPVACSYSFGNASGNAAINNGTVNTNLNADMLDGYHSTSLFRTNVGSIPTAYIDNDLTTANSSDYANYQSGTYSIGRSSSTELFINFAGTGSTSAL
jgi:hypothetical protein